MTQEQIDQIVAVVVQAVADGTLSTYTPVEQVQAILGLVAEQQPVQ